MLMQAFKVAKFQFVEEEKMKEASEQPPSGMDEEASAQPIPAKEFWVPLLAERYEQTIFSELNATGRGRRGRKRVRVYILHGTVIRCASSVLPPLGAGLNVSVCLPFVASQQLISTWLCEGVL